MIRESDEVNLLSSVEVDDDHDISFNPTVPLLQIRYVYPSYGER